MDEKLIEKTAVSVIALCVLIILAVIGLLGWGFIEIIQWLTSK